jgi:hypothetical protein
MWYLSRQCETKQALQALYFVGCAVAAILLMIINDLAARHGAGLAHRQAENMSLRSLEIKGFLVGLEVIVFVLRVFV